MKTLFFALTLHFLLMGPAFSQACTPLGNQTSYGTGNVWIGYVYDNLNFSNYAGYVTEGNAGSASFDESFGGDNANYPTNGCNVYTETFSVRYKLTKTFATGNYQLTVGADDGYRLSIDGGLTWVINSWGDQSYNYTTYAVTLSGTYNLVLEYYENGGGNRVSFSAVALCTGSENQSIYGTGNVWKGYIYSGTLFNQYAGMVTEGTASSASFDESFGGDNVTYNTSACTVQTKLFSARYRLQKTFAPGDYIFNVGGDDGYRLSLDGGLTWIISRWYDQGYNTSFYTATLLGGTYNLVLEYYENDGSNRLSFYINSSVLPLQLLQFDGRANNQTIDLQWKAGSEANTASYEIERSTNGIDFTKLGKLYTGNDNMYKYSDPAPFNGYNYYRLRMLDKNGGYSYSSVIKIEFNAKQRIRIYPSLVSSGAVQLTTTEIIKNGAVDLFDMVGRKIKTVKMPAVLPAAQSLAIPLPALPAGSYVLIIRSGAEVKGKQIIVKVNGQ